MRLSLTLPINYEHPPQVPTSQAHFVGLARDILGTERVFQVLKFHGDLTRTRYVISESSCLAYCATPRTEAMVAIFSFNTLIAPADFGSESETGVPMRAVCRCCTSTPSAV